MYDGGKVDLSWDNKWVSEVKNDAEKWTSEAAIPCAQPGAGGEAYLLVERVSGGDDHA